MIKVLVVDDHPVVRRGLRQIVESEHDMKMVGEAKDAKDFFSLLKNADCSVVLLDISLPDMNGFDVLKQLKYERPKLPVLILSVHPEDQYAVRLIKAGASGYLMKEGVPEELVTAIRRVSAGGKYVSVSLAGKLISHLDTPEKLPHEDLSDREFQVMCMIAEGKTPREIAVTLSISDKTVGTYRARTLEKLKLDTTADLIRYAIEHRLV